MYEANINDYAQTTSINSNGAVARMPAVTAEYGSLVSALDRIGGVTDSLETRLGSVLRERSPEAEADGGNKQAPAGCAFAEGIRSDAERLHRYALQLESILTRLEV